MPVTLVNRQTRQGTAADPVTFSGLTANTTGNGLFLFIGSRTGSANTVGSVTDNIGHTWTIHGTIQNSGSNNRATWAYVPTTTGQVTSISVTLSPTSSTIPISIALFEVSGHDTVTPIHTSNYSPDTVSDTTYNAGSITTSVNDCLVFSGVTISSQSSVTSLTVTAPLGNVSYLAGSATLHMIGTSYAALSGSSAVTATYTSSRSSTSSGAIIAIAPAGTGTHTVALGSWRWYSDDVDGSMTALAAENVAPVLNSAQMQNATIRLRAQIVESGGTSGSGAITVQYGNNDLSQWLTIPDQSGGTTNQPNAWHRWANGAGTASAAITTAKLTGTTQSGLYHEAPSVSAGVTANAVHELDLSIQVRWPPSDTTTTFRILYGGTPLTGSSDITVTTSTAADRPYTIDKHFAGPASKTSSHIGRAPWPKVFWDGAKWWFFIVDDSDTSTLRQYYWSGSGAWVRAADLTLPTSAGSARQTVAFRMVGGTPTYYLVIGTSSTSKRVAKGTVSGNTITWGAFTTVTQANRAHHHVAVDDGGYIWMGAFGDNGGVPLDVWVRRSTSIDDITAWQTAVTATDTDTTANRIFALRGLASNRCLAVWRSGNDLKYAVFTSTTLVSSGTVATNCSPEDWGMTRFGGHVYVVHTDTVADGGDWVVEAFNETTETWATGPTYDRPFMSIYSTDDGLAATTDGSKLYVVGTDAGNWSSDRPLRLQTYSGNGANGTWGTSSIITPVGRGNGDRVVPALEAGNSQLVWAYDFGDDDMEGNNNVIEAHALSLIAVHTTEVRRWRWYTDAADGSMTPLSLENEAPRLTGAQMQNAIVRLRVQLAETGGAAGSGQIKLEYSADGATTWNIVQEQTPAAEQQGWWFRYADGFATAGSTLASTKLTGSTVSGKYHENGSDIESIAADSVQELDIAVRVHWPPPDTSVQFRLMYGGTALPLTSPPVTNIPDPVRGAFYYPWFPGAWRQTGMLSGQSIYPFSYHRPKRGYYNITAGDVSAHIEQMLYGKITMGIISWWGQGSREDLKVPLLLQQARGTNFRWAIYYEQEGFGNPTEAALRSDLNYLVAQYGNHPNSAKINGRLVVFVYAADDSANGNEVLTRWQAANDQANVYIVMKILTGYTGLTPQPDSWHQYAPANRTQSHGNYSYVISPGFELTDRTLDQPYLARDLSAFTTAVSSMESSSARWKLVTTFNEWGENSGVEAADQYASVSGYGDYLDALNAAGSAPASVVGDYPALITSSAEARPYTITRLGADGSQKTSREVRYGAWERTIYAAGRWWFFTAQTEDSLRMYPYVREGDGSWRATTTKATTTSGTQSRQAFAVKEISGNAVVHSIQGTSTSTFRGVRGILDGTAGEVVWGSEWSTTQASDRTRNVAFDDGNYVWVGGIQAGTGIWVRRSTNVDVGTSWTSGFDPQRTAADTAVVSGDVFTLIGLTADKVLAVWRSGTALKWCTVTGSTVSAVGTVNATSVAGPEDWGITRNGNYVYLIHSDIVGSGGNWVLRVYDITAGTWATATSPGVSGQPSNNDGIPLSVDAATNTLYAFGTFANTESGQDRKIRYKAYTWANGSETTGTWGALTDLSPTESRGNSDHISVSRQSGNGEIMVISAFGDDDNAAYPRTAEYFSVTTAATSSGNGVQFQVIWMT